MHYDLEFDKALIESSFAMQYGIRLAREDIAFGEFCRLLAGLMADTPLGRVVGLRMEKEPDRIKGFGEYERGVRKKWQDFVDGRKRDEDRDWDEEISKLQDGLSRVFGT